MSPSYCEWLSYSNVASTIFGHVLNSRVNQTCTVRLTAYDFYGTSAFVDFRVTVLKKLTPYFLNNLDLKYFVKSNTTQKIALPANLMDNNTTRQLFMSY